MRLETLLVGCIAIFSFSACGRLDENSDPRSINAADAYCPAETIFKNGSCVTINGVAAIGPFPDRMKQYCRQYGGGNACDGIYWQPEFVRRIKGPGRCMTGTTLDKSRQVCADAAYAYGPLTKNQHENCVANGGGERCEKLAVELKYLTPSSSMSSTSPAGSNRSGNGSSLLLKSPFGLFNPIPGGVVEGYSDDSGLDITATRLPVYAVADAEVEYSEPGHTPWVDGIDTPNSIRLRLHKPFKFKGRTVTHVWYTHLSKLEFVQSIYQNRRTVKAGQKIGVSGYGNQVGHLHIGFLLDNKVDQRDGTVLSVSDVRFAIGYKIGERLPQ